MTQAISRRYVVVCRGPECRERGSVALRQRLARLTRDRTDVRLVGYSCFGQCECGPNAALYPDPVWFGDLRHPGDAEWLLAHATGQTTDSRTPLQLPADEETEHVRNIEELLGNLSQGKGPRRRWRWWPF